MYSSYGYGSSYDSTYGALAGMSTATTLLAIAFGIFQLICMWRIYMKAGEGGWKVLIPVYNIIIWYKICWKAGIFVILTAVLIVALILTVALIPGAANSSDPSALLGGMGVISLFVVIPILIAFVILDIIANVKLARRFGKSAGFAAGLIFLSPIFRAILAFDRSTYDRRRTEPGYVEAGRYNQGYSQNGYQDYYQNGSQDYYQGGNQGYGQGGGQDFYQNGNQGYGQSGGQDFYQNGNQGYGQNGGQDFYQNGNQGYRQNGGQKNQFDDDNW